MKLTFPPKKFQIISILMAPVAWLLSLAFPISKTFTEFPMLFLYDHNRLFGPILSVSQLLPDPFGKVLFFILVPTLCYGFIAWLAGTTLWMIRNTVKSKQEAEHPDFQDKS